MSDIYIPGVKSKYDSDKLIEGLMKLERVPKERAEKEVETLEGQKTVWQDVGRRISTLRESARSLFSFQNPFNERVAKSSDESVLTATATREATEQERSFLVKKLATADRFLSAPLAEDFKVPQGEYVFAVGETEIAVPFRGGSVKEFADAVMRRGKNKVAVSTIVVEPKTRSLVIESLETGAATLLGFKKDAEKLALEIGIAERVDDKERRFPLDDRSVKTGDPSRISFNENALSVSAGGDARIPLSPGVRIQGSLTLEYEVESSLRKEDTAEESGPPPGPAIPSTGSISFGGVVVESDPSIVPLPPWEPPTPPPRVDDQKVLRLSFSDDSSAYLAPVRDDVGFERGQVRLSEVAGASGKELIAFEVINKNTHRTISLRSLRVFDPDARGGLKAKNPISVAGDAVLSMDGIEVSRGKNEIDDLIPGVKLSLQGTSDKRTKLDIEPDRETAKEAVISLVGNYNRLAAEINVLIRNDDKIIGELTYLNDDERADMQKKLGTMQGDVTLNQLRTSLQRSASASYPTSAERNMALLSQIGVSSDARRPGSGSGLDVSRLRGYLEIDEKTLEQALRERLPAVKELFGNDTDGDLIIDSGFAFAVDSLTKPFVETGGLVQLKTRTIDTKIAQEKRRIDTLDRQLLAKEEDLKRKYGAMEGALNRMERTSSSIDQFSSRNNNE
jgi:flagellar hook-associated protein 2